jgi:ribosomal protein L29
MKPAALAKMSVDELVARFADIARLQYDAILNDRYATYRRLYNEMEAIRQELRVRPDDQRRALLRLLDDKNTQVRLKAAISTLTIEPRRARRILEAIRDGREPYFALDAGMTLRMLDDGSFVPS